MLLARPVQNRWALGCATLVLFACAMMLASQSSSAQSATSYEASECYLANEPYYDAKLPVSAGAYDAYVKLGKRGQSASTSLYVENAGSTTCTAVGSVLTSGETWQKIGTLQSNDSSPVRIQLSSSAFSNIADANRASVLLVPQANPACQPTANCDFTYKGQAAFIIPTSTILSENTLRILQVRDPETDTQLRVDYFSDGQLLYSKPTLEPFDMRFVPSGEHTLSRVIQYKSKQKVVIQSQIYVSFAKDFQNLLFRTLNSNRVGLQILAVLVVLAAVLGSVLLVIHALHRRHMWKDHHGLLQPAQTQLANLPSDYVPPPHLLHEDSPYIQRLKRYSPYLAVLLCLFISIGLIDAYVGQLSRVNGPSMETTLQTDDQLYVNRLPKTWAAINKQEYVPKRGEIIVFRKAHSDLFLEENEEEKNVFVVKRVLGLPGERVLIQNGVVTVFNKTIPDGFRPDENSSWQKTLTLATEENLDIILGPSEIFVGGDNRPESIDSRANGPIELNDILGKVEARVLPFSKRRAL